MEIDYTDIPKRILMTADTVGGVWTYAVELARALAPYEIEVFLATMGGPLRDRQRETVAALPHVSVCESDYKLEWMEDPWEDVAAAGTWLLELAEETAPDLVHLNGYAHAALPWRAPTLVVGHSCVFSWFDAVRGERPPEAWARYHREVVRGLRRAGLVTAPTRAMLAALERHYGAFSAAGAVYNGRCADDFMPGDKEPIVLTAGRLWDEAKNTVALEQVAPQLSWPVYIAGEEQHPDGGRARFAGLRRLGRLSPAELAGWMGRAAIYTLPARYEPFGLTALEAGLAGCALVLGDIPSLREVWGDAALFVSPEDPAALRAALQSLIEDEPLRTRLAHRARCRAMGYTPERMAKGYLACYRRLLYDRRRSALADQLREQAVSS